MIKPIVKDPLFLSLKSEQATIEDASVGTDLMQTLMAHKDECVGMAANMIGVLKRVIVFSNEGMPMLMYNPEIIAKSGEYETEEGCLSLQGERHTKRFENITVKFQDAGFNNRVAKFDGFVAQVIQHEIDHCNGVLI